MHLRQEVENCASTEAEDIRSRVPVWSFARNKSEACIFRHYMIEHMLIIYREYRHSDNFLRTQNLLWAVMVSILQRDWFSLFLIPNLKMNFLSPCTIFGRSKFNFLICRVAWSRKLWWNIDKELVFGRENNFMKSSAISYQVKWMPLHIHACGHVANLERGCVFFFLLI